MSFLHELLLSITCTIYNMSGRVVYSSKILKILNDFGWENRTKSWCKSGRFCIIYTTSVMALISFVFFSWIINEYYIYTVFTFAPTGPSGPLLPLKPVIPCSPGKPMDPVRPTIPFKIHTNWLKSCYKMCYKIATVDLACYQSDNNPPQVSIQISAE